MPKLNYSLELLREFTTKLAKRGETAAIKKELGKYDAKRVGQLQPCQYQSFGDFLYSLI